MADEFKFLNLPLDKREVFRVMDGETAKSVLLALMDYLADGMKDPDGLSPTAYGFYLCIKPVIEKQAMTFKNRSNAVTKKENKGGRPRKVSNASDEMSDNENDLSIDFDSALLNENSEETQTKLNENSNVTQIPLNKKEKSKNVKVKREKEEGKREKDIDIYTAVIERLNLMTGQNYRASSKETQKFIKARLNEGFTLEDFFTVIDKKSREWKDDNEMAQYLRPSTLFGTKFESYLNAKEVAKKSANPFLDMYKKMTQSPDADTNNQWWEDGQSGNNEVTADCEVF